MGVPSDDDRHNPMSKVVARVMAEAIDNAGKAMALSSRIEPIIGRTYADRTVSAWGRGDVMPPADVLLAAAKAVGIPLDERLGLTRGGMALEREIETIRAELEEQRNRIQALEKKSGQPD
jgi:hypothetical protein